MLCVTMSSDLSW